jgi:Rieske Fe-S protein
MSDKYPAETDRRRFVKGVVGGAALSGAGTVGGVSVNSLTNPTGKGGGLTLFYGVENTFGPAPRAMPQIPVEIDDDGFLKGRFPEVKEVTEAGETVEVAEEAVADITYSNRWFQYCGVQTYPGVRVDTVDGFDEYFRYAPGGELPQGLSWQAESDEISEGDKVNVEQFSDYESWGNDVGTSGLGKPAKVTWRSEGLDAEETMIVEVIRSTRVENDAIEGNSEWLNESTKQGFIAYLDKCTHFCCVPSFKGYPGSAKFDGQNGIYCPCHQSIYDPYSIVKKQFTALPRPESIDSGGGGGGGGGH